MKYIDADKLIANLERQNVDKKVIEPVIRIIDSLEQEQPELPKIAEYYYHKGVYEGLSQGRADALKILEESMKRKADPVIIIKQQEQQENKPNLLKSLEEYFERTPKEQLDADWEKLKVWNEIGPDVETYCKTQREQQEVDLGADIEMEWDSFNKHLAEYGKESDEVVWLNWLSFVDIARHFYELGKNSK